MRRDCIATTTVHRKSSPPWNIDYSGRTEGAAKGWKKNVLKNPTRATARARHDATRKNRFLCLRGLLVSETMHLLHSERLALSLLVAAPELRWSDQLLVRGTT